MGHSTNNKGELWAIGMALCFLSEDNAPKLPIYFITDSKFAIGLITLGFKPKAGENDVIAGHIVDLIRNYPNKVRIFHSPGHSDVRGNNVADKLANMGSAKSRSKKLSPVRTRGSRFTYSIAGIPPTI